MKYIVTGGAGFIGSHLVDALMAYKHTEGVRVLDDFSSGRLQHLANNDSDRRLSIFKIDLTSMTDGCGVRSIFKGVDTVFHLAANPDARRGIENTRLDLEQETIATYNVLESMRLAGVKKIIFSSSGTVYGDRGSAVCSESDGPLLPISLYGAGKLASEGLISAFCGTFGMTARILRFGNVVGARLTHGCIHDFMRQLKEHPDHLDVLGDGNQSKPYVHVSDIVRALLFVGHGYCACDVFNVAPAGGTTVRFIAEELATHMVLKPAINYGSTPSGWAGDVPVSRMSAAKLFAHGFDLMPSDDAVYRAITDILKYDHYSKTN